ncbi:hypothetical protein [Halostella litorea]|uniref:hypothetical protein n=1 Tax=Halostella litorea TaxID=2528831 RepID=UPI00109317FC|nr:hypothetical protein [Halostella litorea]
MEGAPSEKHSSERLTVSDVTRTPAGIRAETDAGDYTFRRDRDENVWVPDVGTPPEVIAVVEYEGYNVRTAGGSE